MATLVSILGVYEIVLALSARPAVMVSGILGGLFVAVAPWLVRRSALLATTLLIVGALVWAVLAWWSIIAPVIAIVAVGIGLYVVRTGTRDPLKHQKS
jgi:hypothetical protein